MADFNVDRKWFDARTFDFAVGLGFDYVFFPDATMLEMKVKMDSYTAIVRDIHRLLKVWALGCVRGLRVVLLKG